jgi:hypothetical protein
MVIKKLFLVSLLTFSVPVSAYEMQYRETQCNVYYNNWGKVYAGVPCKAWFANTSTLSRVKVYLPNTKLWYDWGTGYKSVTKDPKWPECIRHTGKQGNQYQVCTQKSPSQLNIK